MRIEASRSAANAGWSSIICTIVGTITDVVTPQRSIVSITAPGSNIGTNVDTAEMAGTTSTPPNDAAWNIGVWWR